MEPIVMRKWTHAKNHLKKFKKRRHFQKPKKTRIWSRWLTRKASKKRGQGDGPNRIWLKIHVFLNEKKCLKGDQSAAYPRDAN